MEKIRSDQLKKIQLEILDYVTKFCDENNINYFLDSGTLIGSVRHKGYIPWDDDIDLGMLREDYNKFISLFNSKNLNKNYCFKCIELDNKFYLPFGKVLDKRTILYEPDEKGHKLSVNIDIFPYDNIPNDENTYRKAICYRDMCQNFNSLRNYRSNFKTLKGFFLSFCKLFILILPKNYFVKKINKHSKKYNGKDSTFVYNGTGFYPYKNRKCLIQTFIKGEFEGKKYNIPSGYDEWLRNIYGDYMQLPPKEQQVTHHSFVAYYEDSVNG